MSRHRSFKQRQSARLHYAIMQEEIEMQRLQDQNQQAEAQLQNELDGLQAIERATHKAFASIEQNLTAHGEVGR